MWCLCTSTGELLACQPYAGVRTSIPDQGLGQGPNVVLGLCQQFGLSPGTKVSADNLFVNFDLCDHMAQNGWGLVGTVRQNRLVGVPLPNKKEASKKMKRGDMETVYSDNICCTVWRDSQPVFIASNYTTPEPMASCRRFDGHGKGYVSVPCPKMVVEYNSSMGGVDLLNQTAKNYAITHRVRKWYWALWTWFLNVQMVQAWRLYRQTMKHRHMLVRESEKAENEEFEKKHMLNKDKIRKDWEEEQRKKRKEEKKIEDMPLLDFIRDSVEMLIVNHGEPRHGRIKEGRLSANNQDSLRKDTNKVHLVVYTDINGRCKNCNKRSQYRCETCNVALHPRECFKAFHSKV